MKLMWTEKIIRVFQHIVPEEPDVHVGKKNVI